MGSNTSKPNNETTVLPLKNDIEICDNQDPRSPTPEIIRTPLQGKTGAKHNITKNVDLRKTFESAKSDEKLIHKNPILSAVIKNHLQSYDPRSPTQEFERTPIIIASKVDDVVPDKRILRHQNNNCASPHLKTDDDDNFDSCAEANEMSPELVIPKNLCDQFYEVTLNESLKDNEEPLGSSTASNDAIEGNISNESGEKPTKLLETNFDYTECNNENFEDSKENIQSTDVVETEYEVKKIPLFEILGDDPRSPSVGIERTPIVIAKVDQDANENNVEKMSDDTLIKVLQNTNSELRQTVTKSQDKNTEGLLIYEDEQTHINETPKKSKSASSSGSRTPLSCMKNNADIVHTRSKSANTLYDPKVGNTKIPRRVSHIPRLKSLTKPSKLLQTGSSISLKNISKTSAISGDCENTPPHSHRDRWDKDNSIVL